MDSSLLPLAARNIALEVASPPARFALVICSTDKLALAQAVAGELEARNVEHRLLELGREGPQADDALVALARDVAREGRLVLLLQPEHAPFLFELAGRPDRGLKLPLERFFSDWLMSPAGVVQTYGVDREELERFRRALLSRLEGAREIHISSAAGTDITLRPRGWRASHGEVYTAPEERLTNGAIRVDGCAYGGPPANPFALRIEIGRVTNLDDLDPADEQQRWVRQDMRHDENANVLAELGIGVNQGARWDADLMEAEQARGTCHFGFGHNIPYGGRNESGYHFDLVIRRPTIEVDGRCVCRAGKYLTRSTAPRDEGPP